MIKFFIKVGFINLLIMFVVSFISPLHRVFLRDIKGSSVVMITDASGRMGGTGFGVEYEGSKYIMTNAHVCGINNYTKTGIYVTIDNRKVRAKIKEVYKDHDLCIMHHIEGVSTLSIGEAPSKGEMLHIVGYPSLQPKTLTSGEFVGYGTIQVLIEQAISTRDFKECRRGDIVEQTWMGAACIRKFYASYTTIPILGGSSGSPVINDYGNVVGVAFAGSPMLGNWAKVVPVEFIKKFLYSHHMKEKK